MNFWRITFFYKYNTAPATVLVRRSCVFRREPPVPRRGVRHVYSSHKGFGEPVPPPCKKICISSPAKRSSWPTSDTHPLPSLLLPYSPAPLLPSLGGAINPRRRWGIGFRTVRLDVRGRTAYLGVSRPLIRPRPGRRAITGRTISPPFSYPLCVGSSKTMSVRRRGKGRRGGHLARGCPFSTYPFLLAFAIRPAETRSVPLSCSSHLSSNGTCAVDPNPGSATRDSLTRSNPYTWPSPPRSGSGIGCSSRRPPGRDRRIRSWTCCAPGFNFGQRSITPG